MTLKSDFNGLFIEGMTDASELGRYLQLKFSEEEIQTSYANTVDEAQKTARTEKASPLRMF